MRLTFISFSLFLLIVPAYLASASALAVPLKKGPERLKPVAASPEQKNIPVSGPSILTTNYLVTLSRVVSNLDKDNLFDYLMEKGAVVKQVYDYRVYKGVLFSIPDSADEGIDQWKSSLLKLDGVKYVEKDEIVKIS